MKAVKKHTDNKWIILYIERWLKAPMQMPDGSLRERNRGVPQGSCIGPVLSNLFMHYVYDAWMKMEHPETPWSRYADDGLAHCKTEQQAEQLLAELEERFKACGLELHPDKTKIVYCKDGKRKRKYPKTAFDYLGYTFRQRTVKNRIDNSLFKSFTPAVSKTALKSMRAETRKQNIRNRTEFSLKEIADKYNPVLRGWIGYYGRYSISSIYPVFKHFNGTLHAWAMRKYKKLNKTRAANFLQKIAEREPQLFVHWKLGVDYAFA